MDLAAWSGAGRFLKLGKGIRQIKPNFAPSFGGWADEIWERSRERYGLMAVRDAETLNALYSDIRFLRVRTADGWAVLLDTQMQGHKQFGDMRVGTIVDCLAPPEGADGVIRTAASALEQRGVDLIVSNQLHPAWSRALLAAGFRQGPSNYLLALSPEFAAAAARGGEFHFNRGDGDGPIHL